jgi:excisionase family DNA binding protein
MKVLTDQEGVEEDLKTGFPKKYYSTSEAAQALAVSAKTIRRWDTIGELHCIRTKGKHRRIPVSEIARIKLLKEVKRYDYSGEEGKLKQDLWAHLPRHELRALKNQLKTVKILLTTTATQQVTSAGVVMLISLLVEILQTNEIIPSLKNLCKQLQATLMELNLKIEDDENQRTANEPCTILQKMSKTPSIFGKARERSLEVFWDLVRAKTDSRYEEEERQRAHKLVERILTPYQRLTSYLTLYSEGTLEHDVSKLLLTRHPMDFGIIRIRWSVRTLSKVCRKHLGTKNASKSQVGRFYKKLEWYKPIKQTLVSPDQYFGTKMKDLGMTMASLTGDDLMLFGDEFKFTSTKIREHITPTHAPEGLRLRLKEGAGNYYSSVCKLDLTGLYNPQFRYLKVTELQSFDSQGYFQALVNLIRHFLPSIKGNLYLVLDNGSIHRPEVLQEQLKDICGNRVHAIFLPTYSPNNNPIERVWQQLLNAVVRSCSTPEELRDALTLAVTEQKRSAQEQSPTPLKLSCPVCQDKFVFENLPNIELATKVSNHLCFNIPHLNPYTIQVLTHSLEIDSLGQLA